MASGPKNVTSTQKNEPWAGAMAPLMRLYANSEKAYEETNRNPYTGQMYAGQNNIQAGAAYDLANNNFGGGAAQSRQAAGQIGQSTQSLAGLGGYSPQGNSVYGTNSNQMRHYADATTSLADKNTGWADQVHGLAGGISAAAAPLLTSAADVEAMAKDLTSGKWLSAESNPYLQGVVDVAGRNITDRYQRTIAPSLEDAAIKSGAYGGARNGFATAQAAADTQQNLSDTIMGLYGQNYKNERDNMMQAGNVYNQAGNLRSTYGNMQAQAAGVIGQAGQMLGQSGNMIGQAGNLIGAADENDRSNYNTTQQSLLNGLTGQIAGGQASAGLWDSANQQELLGIQGRATAGQQVQAWDQALLDDAFTRYQLEQQAPWAGTSELLSVLTGGNFSTTTSTQPNPNYRSPMQNIMGLAGTALGFVNPLSSLMGGMKGMNGAGLF